MNEPGRSEADERPRAPSGLDARLSSPGSADGARIAQALSAHLALVWRSLRRFGVPEADADDAAQLAFMTLSDRLADIVPGSERSFLLGTCLRIAANQRRKRTRNPELLDFDPDRRESDGLDPEQAVTKKQERALLDEGLEALPLDQRTVFVLFELEGFSLPEIAENLGIPLGTATSRLRRARGRFEAWVETRNLSGELP